MIIHDFRCEKGHLTEEYVQRDTKQIACPKCGGLAHRVFTVAPRVDWLSLGSSAGASPEAIAKFDRMHREQKAKEEKSLKEHGDYGKAPGS